MKKLAGAVAAIAISVGALTAAPAWATDNIKPFGDQERIIDTNGNPLIGYTAQDLVPSTDDVPHNGQLYEATMTIEAFGIPANPPINRFAARAETGDGYPVIADAAGGLSAAQVPADTKSTGKLYFDVVGPVPNSVVFTDGMRDILAWVPGPSIGGTRP